MVNDTKWNRCRNGVVSAVAQLYIIKLLLALYILLVSPQISGLPTLTRFLPTLDPKKNSFTIRCPPHNHLRLQSRQQQIQLCSRSSVPSATPRRPNIDALPATRVPVPSHVQSAIKHTNNVAAPVIRPHISNVPLSRLPLR